MFEAVGVHGFDILWYGHSQVPVGDDGGGATEKDSEAKQEKRRTGEHDCVGGGHLFL